MTKNSKVNVKGKKVAIKGDVVARDKVTTNNNITNIEAAVPLALSLHQLPPPPRDFTGREAELKELLAHVETGAVISGLRGQGGIGKTVLALKLAEHLTPHYPDAQFYLDLKGVSDKPLTPAEALAHVIRAYHLTSKLPESEAELRALYLSVLHEKRALLLMDNAKDAAQVNPLIPPATCYLLITSRQHFHLPGLFAKDLEQMQPDEARELLLNIARRMGEHADVIAKLCGYLPLALRLTASALAERRDLSPTDLIRKLSDAQTRLKLTGADASLQLSYDLLTPELQKLWRALAVFPDTFDRTAAAAVWTMEEDAAHDALSELVRLSMLDFSPHPTPLPSGERESLERESPSPSGRGDRGEGEHPGRYRLHDLARLYADTRLPERKRYEAQKRHAVHYETVLLSASDLYLQGNESIKYGLNLFDLEWKNFQAGQAWAEVYANKDNVAEQLCSAYPNAGADLLELRQYPPERIRWHETALTSAKRLKDRPAEGAHRNSLGLAYMNLGEARKAIKFFEQALAISHEIGDRRNEGAIQGNLGVVYRNLGDARKAIKFFEQALAISREIGDQRSEGATLCSLGSAYADLGENHKAVEFYEQALFIDQEIGDRRGEGADLGNIGIAYYNLGEPHKAIAFFEQVLVIDREIGDRRGEGNALWNMSLVFNKLGERAQAIICAEAALKTLEQIEDPRRKIIRRQLEEWQG